MLHYITYYIALGLYSSTACSIAARYMSVAISIVIVVTCIIIIMIILLLLLIIIIISSSKSK